MLLPVEGTVHSLILGLDPGRVLRRGCWRTIEQLAFVFRNANGSIVGKTSDEGDIFYNVSDGSFEVALTSPAVPLSWKPGQHRHSAVQATQPCDLTLHVNGELVASGMGTS